MAFCISTSGNAGILYMSARRTPSGVTSQSVKAPIVPANDRSSFSLGACDGGRIRSLDRSESACDGRKCSSSGRGLMKKITLLALIAGAIISLEGSAAAQGIYLDFGNNPGPRYRDYDDGPRYRDRERFRGERYGDRRDRGDRGYYRPGGYKTFNGCQNGWTVQDGLCKPYRGY